MGMEIRADIAAALSTVADITGHPYRPSAPRVGDAWPKWTGGPHVAPGVVETGWAVYVLLPSDEQAQDTWITGHLDVLLEALAPLLWVESVEAGASLDSPALILNGKE